MISDAPKAGLINGKPMRQSRIQRSPLSPLAAAEFPNGVSKSRVLLILWLVWKAVALHRLTCYYTNYQLREVFPKVEELALPPLRRDDDAPLYKQIKRLLVGMIEDGKLAPGDRVPSENDLRSRLNVSAITVKQALKELEFEGYVERIQGKGTFVRQRKIVKRTVQSLTENMREYGHTVTSRVLGITEIHPDYRIAKAFGISEDERLIEVRRLRFIDNDPVILTHSYFTLEFGRRLITQDLEGSFFELFEALSGEPVASIKQVIEIRLSTPDEERLLNMPKLSPVAVLEGQTLLRSGTLIEYTNTVFRGDRFRFSWEGARYTEQDSSPGM